MIKIGTDVVQIPRIEAIFSKFGESFCKRILQSAEIEIFKSLKTRNCHYLAKRFAAKEAIAKAFGVGIGSLLRFSDMLIYNDKLGAPKASIKQGALSVILPNGFSNCEISLSISDDYPIVVVVCIITFLK